MKIIYGLGNPGKEYENTRHNAGRIVARLIESNFEGKKIKFLESSLFMNDSGGALVKLVKSKKDLKDLVVIYDDMDLPLGSIKISFDRGDGGHKGLASVIKKVKSREFVRIRVGISPTTPTGKLRKPKGEDKVVKFVLGEWKKEELAILKKVAKKVAGAVEMIFSEGKDKAMTLFN